MCFAPETEMTEDFMRESAQQMERLHAGLGRNSEDEPEEEEEDAE